MIFLYLYKKKQWLTKGALLDEKGIDVRRNGKENGEKKKGKRVKGSEEVIYQDIRTSFSFIEQ